jgi:hypothetical protein
MARCFDCLRDFAADEDRFAVLKQMRDIPPEVEPFLDAQERRWYRSMNQDPVFVCEDCAGWYGDHPIRLTAAEAEA